MRQIEKSLSIRNRRTQRQHNQNKVLNSLRTAYFLSPEKLKAEGINGENILNDTQRAKLFEKMGLSPNSIGYEELYVFVVQQEFLLETYFPSQADATRMSSEEKRKLTADGIKKWGQHWANPETMYVLAKNKNPKAIQLKKFIERIITYQNFELKKLGRDTGGKIQKSYLELLQETMTRNVGAYEASCIKAGIKMAKKNEAILRKNPDYLKHGITDKNIASVLYKSVSKKNLQRVRQDRKRLKKYHFI